MLIDARSLPDESVIETDVCVAGAGVAGVTLAKEFLKAKFRVCLLESGGRGPDKATQSLYWGGNIGHPYFPLDTARTCGFGGTSHRWCCMIGDNRLGVRLRPLDGIDFEERDWMPYSGWPFNKAHLDPFYERAQSICQIGPFTYAVKDWEDSRKTPSLPFIDDRVQTTIFQFGSRDPFINEYCEEVVKSENITALAYANVVEIETDEQADRVTRLQAACLNGKKFRIAARIFILSLGAIETPRLLLLSNKVQKEGLGNRFDIVGRFFMEHPHLWSGVYVPSDSGALYSTGLYRVHRVNNVPVMGKLTLSEDTMRREKIVNYCVSIHPHVPRKRPDIAAAWPVVSWPLLGSKVPEKKSNQVDLKSCIAKEQILYMQSNREKSSNNRQSGEKRKPFGPFSALGNVANRASGRIRRGCRTVLRKFGCYDRRVVFHLNHMTEQAPNPDSRVILLDERDVLGRKRICLDWRLSSIDMYSIIRAQEIIDEELRKAELGRLRIDLKGVVPPLHLEGGWHHMGTTRMHVNPEKGVVNENCRVHGISNLYVAGPSVFPTSGYANPVLTIVALSVRLADYIKELMR